MPRPTTWVLFQSTLVGSANVGGAAGGVIGDLHRGTSRADLKQLDELDEGEAALIVGGDSKVDQRTERAIKHARRAMEKQPDPDAEEFRRELESAAKQEAAS
jgi:hypothetical protein